MFSKMNLWRINNRNKNRKNDKAIAFFIGWALLVLWLSFFCDMNFVFDSSGYSMMADEFMKQGLFNFHLNLEEGSIIKELFAIRAYGWPYIIAIIKTLGLNTRMGWIITWSMFISLTLTYIVPEVFTLLFQCRIRIIPRLALTVFTILFWPGLFLYPLSDLPAVTFSFGGILVLLKANKRRLGTQSILMFVTGFILQFSYYIRTGCNTTLLVAFIIIIVCLKCSQFETLSKYIRKGVYVICFVLGMCVAMIPQIIINYECNGKMTYEVPINFTMNIVDLEWYSGVSTFRYETNASQYYPNAAMLTHDSTAEVLLKNDNIKPEEARAKDIILQIIRHPFEYLGIFIAKIINYIDVRYGEVYLKELYPFKYLLILINYALWFITGVGIIYQLGVKRIDSTSKIKNIELLNIFYFIRNKFIYILACVAPALLHIAGTHVEPRYIYPLFIFMWGYLIFICPYKDLFSFIRKRLITVASCFILLLGVCWAVWNFTFQQFPYYELFYQEQPKIYGVEDFKKQEFDNGTSEVIVFNEQEYEFNDNLLTLWAYAFILGKDSKNTRISLVLENEIVEYVYDLEVSKRDDVAEAYGSTEYSNSGIYFSQYLWGVQAGKYKIKILLENGETKYLYDTSEEITLS